MDANKKTLYYLAGAFALLAVLVLWSLLPDGFTESASYTQVLEEYRKEKDHQFATSADSPIPRNQRGAFRGLRYYSPDSAYRVVANFVSTPLTDSSAQTHFVVENGEGLVYAGKLQFELQGNALQLAAYRSVDRPTTELFVPFRDATSGTETYGGGRYLDINVSTGQSVVLDFNYAYQPYCAYNPQYVCALPPRTNYLTLPIRAGERQ